MSRLAGFTSGQSLAARAFRSGGLTILGYGGSQALRLASNLILTRLLFPEAFGVMSLVWVFLQGLSNLSDMGVTQSILQSKRGEDRAFLDTAWTIQVLRGVLLLVVTWVLAAPVAAFYDAPELANILPVVGVTLLVMGLFPTKVDSANRNLVLGRITAIDLIAQVIGLIVGVIVAWATGSVWALVANAMTAVIMQLVLYQLFLPGESNKPRWEPSAARELIKFGKWIFLSTAAGFLLSQGDKIVLGKVLNLGSLGVYNIGYFLASFPLLLGGMVTRRILIPIYREKPPSESSENRAKLHKMRLLISGGLMALVASFALMGVWLVSVLYDPRYALAGGVVVLLAVMQIPQIITLTYDQAALAAGDSRGFFVLAATRATLMMTGLIFGAAQAGLTGALLGQGLAMVLAYPVVIWLARRHGAWDKRHDVIFGCVGALVAMTAFGVHQTSIYGLSALNLP
ncbi:oligosaccharide flippase family protein [Shimia haliotis]|uniref:Membrane protein involved in the export of O-antigen and teichoic acid n=1 Tax=Shimia haliotis TaxID=1280847 RepID=A0A1I4GFM9_9RHOB|nr:oligosaccharide flippase family protein [Shimia haliotis]SFL28343.1 Membrane protein involved in the export of O-antigen and teichoic acid [Shimia haliotis]